MEGLFIDLLNNIRSERSMDVNPQYLRQLPIANVDMLAQKPFIKLVDKILTAKKSNPQADTTALEAEIDQLVYELYELTEDEIAIVEESVG